MTDTHRFIIDLFSWDSVNCIYKKKDDGLLYLGTDGVMKITNTKEDVNYLLVNIKQQDVQVISRAKNNISTMYCNDENLDSEHKTNFTIDYEMYFKPHKFGIRFDGSSTASSEKFYTNMRGILSLIFKN